MNKYWWKEDDGSYQCVFANNHEHYGNYLYLYKDNEKHILNGIINLERIYFINIIWDFPYDSEEI